MATLVGTVVAIGIDVPVKKQGGGTYQGWELVYKSDGGEIRTIAKPMTGLRFNRALADNLAELAVGDVFTLTQEKNAQGFNDVKTIVKGKAEVDIPTQQAPRNSGTTTARPTGTYETPEERAIKQRLIVRQSSLSAAIEILKEDKKTPLNLENATALADSLTAWVYESGNATANQIPDLGDDIPT